MIDGINCRVLGESYINILNNEQLQFKELFNRFQAKYKGLIIDIFKNNYICHLRGSIHLFYNNGEHNANMFTYTYFIDALSKLKEELHINSSDLQIMRFEVGINIKLDCSPKQYLNTITEIQNRMPAKSRDRLTVEYTQYVIKVYSKSHKYRAFKDLNILRIEIAYKKKQKISHDIGCLLMLDELLDHTIWRKMAEVLQALIKKFTFFDYSEINKKDLTIDEALAFYEWSNPVRLYQEVDRSKVSRKRKKAMSIYMKYSKQRKKNELIKRANETIQESLSFL